MFILSMDIEQYDCPFITNTDDFEVFYYMPYWDFKNDRLVNWGYAFSSDSEELYNSLSALPKQKNFLKFDLLSKGEKDCLIKTEINFTNAMSIIRKYSGCICGPFLIKEGHEIWHIAFDNRENISSAITELSKENEIIRIEKIDVTTNELQKLLRLIPVLNSLIVSLESLNPREREIIRTSVEHGFFDDPKKIKIQELANKLGISKGILSRKLRLIEKKTFQELCKILSTIEAIEQIKEDPNSRSSWKLNFKPEWQKVKKFRKF